MDLRGMLRLNPMEFHHPLHSATLTVEISRQHRDRSLQIPVAAVSPVSHRRLVEDSQTLTKEPTIRHRPAISEPPRRMEAIVVVAASIRASKQPPMCRREDRSEVMEATVAVGASLHPPLAVTHPSHHPRLLRRLEDPPEIPIMKGNHVVILHRQLAVATGIAVERNITLATATLSLPMRDLIPTAISHSVRRRVELKGVGISILLTNTISHEERTAVVHKTLATALAIGTSPLRLSPLRHGIVGTPEMSPNGQTTMPTIGISDFNMFICFSLKIRLMLFINTLPGNGVVIKALYSVHISSEVTNVEKDTLTSS
jgi:hypothetical protein